MSKRPLKVFTCDDHDGVWLGGASVVVARDEDEARRMLRDELRERGLDPERGTLRPLDIRHASVTVLWNGDY